MYIYIYTHTYTHTHGQTDRQTDRHTCNTWEGRPMMSVITPLMPTLTRMYHEKEDTNETSSVCR
jgi:hypothetical protein